jgi:hypothetical protein
VPEVVEPDAWEPSFLQKGSEGPLPEVGGVNERALPRGEHKPLVLIEVTKALHLLHLVSEVSFESLNCCLC